MLQVLAPDNVWAMGTERPLVRVPRGPSRGTGVDPELHPDETKRFLGDATAVIAGVTEEPSTLPTKEVAGV